MFSAGVRIAHPSSRRSPLGLELLEARELWARYWWVGDFNNQYAFFSPGPPGKNWVVSETRPVNVTPATPRPFSAPGGLDDLMFDGAVAKGDCYWGEGPGTVRSIHLVNGFTYTVDLNKPVTAAGPGPSPGNFAFELRSGKIEQEEGDTLTVRGKAEWTGGDLNVTNEMANLAFVGAAAVAMIDPAGGTLRTNNNLIAADGAKVTVVNGTVLSALDTAIYVTGGSSLVGAAVRLVGPTPTDKAVNVSGGSVVSLTGTFTTRALSVTGPSTAKILGQNQTTTFEGRLPGGIAVHVEQPEENNIQPFLVIEHGATLDAGDGNVDIDGGVLVTQAAPNVAAQPAAVIKADTLNTTTRWTYIRISETWRNPPKNGQPDNTHHYAKLLVQGDIGFYGGSFEVHVDPANNGVCDKWESTGTIRVDGVNTQIDPWENLPAGRANTYGVLIGQNGILPGFGVLIPEQLPRFPPNRDWAWVGGTGYSDEEMLGPKTWSMVWTG